VVILNARREPTLLRNDTPSDRHWIQFQLEGMSTKRDGVGARVEVVVGELKQVGEVHSGRGCQSHYGSRLHFGLGQHTSVIQISIRFSIRWVGGGADVLRQVPADRVFIIREVGRGLPVTRALR
jgi:hypothetical protein